MVGGTYRPVSSAPGYIVPGLTRVTAPSAAANVFKPPPPEDLSAKPVTLYVGSLCAEIEDVFFKALLDKCGTVNSWKRVKETFGFVEYNSPDGAIRALKVLSGIKLEEMIIKIKAGTEAKDLIERYKAQVVAPPPPRPGELPPIDKDATALALVDELVTEAGGERVEVEEEEEEPPKKEEKGKSPDGRRSYEKLRDKIKPSNSHERSEKRKKRSRSGGDRRRDRDKDRRRDRGKDKKDKKERRERDKEREGRREREKRREEREKDRKERRRSKSRDKKKKKKKKRKREERQAEEAVELADVAEIEPEAPVGDASPAVSKEEEQEERIEFDPDHGPVAGRILTLKDLGGRLELDETDSPHRGRKRQRDEDDQENERLWNSAEPPAKKQKAASPAPAVPAARNSSGSQAKSAPKTAKDIINIIPKDQAELLAFPLDWDVVEQAQIVEITMRQWIDARIQEYLGESEADLTNFVVGLLANRTDPKAVIDEMAMVLVEDAESFVIKMWRRLIFETLKSTHHIS